ncbi:hypothetical protein EYR40_007344 [Pleurotus pulmonarius]|nr:hypothetical protein EYR40_007344 [Pleurotus pulmonarius]
MYIRAIAIVKSERDQARENMYIALLEQRKRGGRITEVSASTPSREQPHRLWGACIAIQFLCVMDKVDDPETFKLEHHLAMKYGTKTEDDGTAFRDNMHFGSGRRWGREFSYVLSLNFSTSRFSKRTPVLSSYRQLIR